MIEGQLWRFWFGWQAFAKGLDLDGMNPELQEGSKAARELLSLEQLHQVSTRVSAIFSHNEAHQCFLR